MPTVTEVFAIENSTDKGYPVYLKDHILSHTISGKDMEKALEISRAGEWKYDPEAGAEPGIRTLRGECATKYGVLITGTAGLGKSCLAGKLIERFRDHSLLVIHGKLEASHIITRYGELYREHRKPEWTKLLKADKPFEERLNDLFALAFRDFPVIICLDDFEQNLKRSGDEWFVEEQYLPIVRGILSSIGFSEGKAKLIITSRYGFKLEDNGENLADKVLEHIPLLSFRGADLRKKENQASLYSLGQISGFVQGRCQRQPPSARMAGRNRGT